MTAPRPPVVARRRARRHAARAVPALALLALAACANPRAEQAAMAPQLFVGMPKQTLLSCAGVPERTASVDNLEFYTYASRSVYSTPASSLGLYGGRYYRPWGYGFGYGFPATGYDVQERSCEATFTLRNGAVERLVYGGDSGGDSRLSQCYSIVENCLQLAERQPRLPAAPQPAPAPRP